MTIIPAWIKSQDESGVRALLGSEPAADAAEVLIPLSDVSRVVIPDSGPVVDGYRFGVVVLHDTSEIFS